MSLPDCLPVLVDLQNSVVVTAQASGNGPHWLDYTRAVATIVTAIVAAIGVGIAWFALRASRKGAFNSAESVKRADAALRGAVRPVLTVESFNGRGLRVFNAGPGVALDVTVKIAATVSVPSWAYPVELYEDPGRIAVLASKTHWEMPVCRRDGQAANEDHILVLLRCRDVDGERHWTLLSTSAEGWPTKIPTHVGTGPDTLPVTHFEERWARLAKPVNADETP